MSSEQLNRDAEVVTAPVQEDAPKDGGVPAVEKSFHEKVMERVEKSESQEAPKAEAKTPEVPAKPEAQSEAKAPEAAVIAERRKWQKRQDKVSTEVAELRNTVQSLMDRLENKQPAQQGVTKRDNNDEYILANQDDPLVKKLLAAQAEIDGLKSTNAEHGSYIDKMKTQETTQWIDSTEKALESDFKGVIPDVWKAKEEGSTKTRFNEFEAWIVQPGNEWAFSSPETMKSAFKQFFYDDILSAKITEARDEALKRKADAANSGITPPQQAAGTPSAFGKNRSFHERVMERVAATGGG